MTTVLASDNKDRVQSWRRQAEALGAPFYRVILIGRSGEAKDKTINLGKPVEPDSEEDFYTAKEVEDLIPELRHCNARGFDIYLTPIDPGYHYMVIEKMKPGSAAQLELLGYRPCLVQCSSDSNEQAVLKVPRTHQADEQSLANRIVKGRKGELGEPKISVVNHPFRMAGFSNQMEGRQGAITRVLSSTHRICVRASEWLMGHRDLVDATRTPQVSYPVKSARGQSAAAHGNVQDAVAAFTATTERARC